MKPRTPNRITLISVAVAGLAWAARAELISYSYDTAGRLTGANHASGPSETLQYDPVGNLTRTTTSAVAGDTDNDGMSDAWELQYFGNLTRDGSGDFDGDGMNDLGEFLAGTHPLLSASALRIIRLTPAPGVSALLEWTSVPGKSYRLQYKDSLTAVTWLDLPGEVTANAAVSAATDNTLSGVTRRFYRVSVITSPSPPRLTVLRSNQLLVVNWPSSTPAGFMLETATNVAPSAAWSPVTNTPSDNGALKTVIFDLNLLDPYRFFRLRQ